MVVKNHFCGIKVCFRYHRTIFGVRHLRLSVPQFFVRPRILKIIIKSSHIRKIAKYIEKNRIFENTIDKIVLIC